MRIKPIVILASVILVAAYAYLGTGYMKQRQEHEILTTQITDATQALAQVAEPSQDLEQRLADAEAKLNAVEGSFPARVNSTQVINSILSLAGRCNVTAIPLVSEPRSTENIKEHVYPVFRLNVTVKGSYSQIYKFVSELGTGEYETLIVEDLRITRPINESEGGTINEATTVTTAIVSLTIYTQSPTSG